MEQFDAWVTAREGETTQKPAPPAPKKPVIDVPKYGTLRDLLDLAPPDESPLTPEQEAFLASLTSGTFDLDTLTFPEGDT